jgi:S1-C subfamily serine protease
VGVRRVLVACVVVTAVVAGTATPTTPRGLDTAPVPLPELARWLAARVDRVVAFGCGLSSNAGTAAVLADGRAVTNRHVVDGALLVNVVPDRGRVVVGAGVVSPAADVAVLGAGPGRTGLLLALSDPRPGDELVVAGYPEGGLTLRVGRARLVDYVDGTSRGEPGPVMRLAYRAARGMSGGPVVDRAGNLVGMLFAVERDTGLSLAIPASRLRTLLGADAFVAPSRCSLAVAR